MNRSCLYRPLGFAAFFLLASCRGPSPAVKDVSIAVENRDFSIYGMTIVVANESGGEGQIKVKGSLVERRTGLTYKEEKAIDLGPRETTSIHLRITAPLGEYVPKAEVEYPPE